MLYNNYLFDNLSSLRIAFTVIQRLCDTSLPSGSNNMYNVPDFMEYEQADNIFFVFRKLLKSFHLL